MACIIGDRCEIESSIDVGFRPNLNMGNGCQINQGVTLKRAEIGKNVMIAAGVTLHDRFNNFEQLDISVAKQEGCLQVGQNTGIMPSIETH